MPARLQANQAGSRYKVKQQFCGAAESNGTVVGLYSCNSVGPPIAQFLADGPLLGECLADFLHIQLVFARAVTRIETATTREANHVRFDPALANSDEQHSAFPVMSKSLVCTLGMRGLIPSRINASKRPHSVDRLVFARPTIASGIPVARP